MADSNPSAEQGTSRVQMLAAEQIEKQARVCSANLERVRDKIESINGDVTDIASQLRELREQVAGLTTRSLSQAQYEPSGVPDNPGYWTPWTVPRSPLLAPRHRSVCATP